MTVASLAATACTSSWLPRWMTPLIASVNVPDTLDLTGMAAAASGMAAELTGCDVAVADASVAAVPLVALVADAIPADVDCPAAPPTAGRRGKLLHPARTAN